MSAGVDTRSTLRKAWANDTVKILVVLAILYGLYLGLGSMLGYSFRGQLNSLARLTFLIAIYALLALALNLHWGYTGLFNIGIAGFIAVALYTMAMVSKPVATDTGAATVSGLGLPIWVGILAGMAAAALLGLLVALPALRLRADYLAIVTIAMSEIVRFFYMSGSFQQFTLLGRDLGTGGGRGLILNYDDPMNYIFESGPYQSLVGTMEPMVDGSIEPVLNSATYAVVLLVAFVTIYYWLLRRIGQSPFGRVLKAIREDEQVANALGKNTASFKIKSFMVGCALMGLAGILWQFRQGAVTPTAFRPRITFFVWVALIIGGAGSNTGSILGGAIFAAVLFQGPRYVKNVVNNTIQLPNAPRTFAEAMGPLLDPLLVADSQLLSAVPVLLFLTVVFGTIYGAMWLSRNRRAELTERVGATVDEYPDVRDGLARAASTVGLTTDRRAWVKRGIWLVGIAAFFLVWGLLTLAGGDAEPFFAYALSEINALQLVIMGLVLVVIVQVRPEGLLGHRKETAAGVRLLDSEGRAIRPKKATTDGGEEE